MKKLIYMFVFMTIGICSSANGAELGNFEYYYDQTNGFLNQEDNLPTFGHVCAPLSVIIGQNYFEQKYTMSTYRTFDTLKADLIELYSGIGVTFNTDVSAYGTYYILDDLCFSPNLHVNYGTTIVERDRAYTKIKQEIGDDKVVICFIASGSTILPSSIRNSGNHAIVVYGTYSSGTVEYVKYVDPWNGNKEEVSKDVFKAALWLTDCNDFVSFDN